MTIPALFGLSILVVEGKQSIASDLRSELIKLGANVHVVGNVETGIMIARRKRLHGAILDCITHGASLPLCAELSANRVPFMFYGGFTGNGADETATCLVELISIEQGKPARERRLQTNGSGEDWHRM